MGKSNDMVALRVEACGPVEALYQLELAEKCALALAAAARERAQHHTAAGLDRAACLLRAQQFELVARFS